MKKVDLKVLDLRMAEALPSYGTTGAAGLDLRAASPGKCPLPQGAVQTLEHRDDAAVCGEPYAR